MNNIITQFNLIVEDLLQQTTTMLGFKYLFNFKTIVIFNCGAPIDKFTTIMLPYKEYIMKKNTSFFMNKDIKTPDYSTDIIDLKKIFMTIDDDSKNNIWDSLQALILLCEDRLAINIKNKSVNKYY